MIGQDAGVRESVHVALDLPFEVGHAPAPVDEEEGDGEHDLERGAGEVGPVADVGEAEALHDLVQVLHVLPRHGVDVLAAERVLDEELVELLDLVARGESPGTRRKKTVRALNVGRGRENIVCLPFKSSLNVRKESFSRCLCFVPLGKKESRLKRTLGMKVRMYANSEGKGYLQSGPQQPPTLNASGKIRLCSRI